LEPELQNRVLDQGIDACIPALPSWSLTRQIVEEFHTKLQRG